MSNTDNTVDVAQKSFYSANGNCIEVAFQKDGPVLIRDTKHEKTQPTSCLIFGMARTHSKNTIRGHLVRLIRGGKENVFTADQSDFPRSRSIVGIVSSVIRSIKYSLRQTDGPAS